MLRAVSVCLFMLCHKITGRQEMQLTLVMIVFPSNHIKWPYLILQCFYLWLLLASKACSVYTLTLATKTVTVLPPTLPNINTWYALIWTFLLIRKFASCSHISALLKSKFSVKIVSFCIHWLQKSSNTRQVLLLRVLSKKQPCYSRHKDAVVQEIIKINR